MLKDVGESNLNKQTIGINIELVAWWPMMVSECQCQICKPVGGGTVTETDWPTLGTA